MGQTYVRTDKVTDRQTYVRTDKVTDRQTYVRTDKVTYTNFLCSD
jgi:hypothetical protein